MSEIEHRGVPKPTEVKRERRDPTDWRPRDNRDYDEAQVQVTPDHLESQPLIFHELGDKAKKEPTSIWQIEQTALADLRYRMNQLRMHPDERSLRVHWQLVVEGYGFKAPGGFIHPEAPEDIQQESQSAWKRCVELATDSMAKVIFVRVWRKKQRAIDAPARKEIES